MERFFEGIGKGKESVSIPVQRMDARQVVLHLHRPRGCQGRGLQIDDHARVLNARDVRTHTPIRNRGQTSLSSVYRLDAVSSLSLWLFQPRFTDTFCGALTGNLSNSDRNNIVPLQGIIAFDARTCTRALILTRGRKVRARVRTVTRMQA